MISLGLRADPKVVETRESYTDQILTGLFTMGVGGVVPRHCPGDRCP